MKQPAQYFDPDTELDEATSLDLDKKLKDLLQPEEPPIYSVILHNDPINGVDYVSGVIKKVFGYSISKAIWLMLKAHFSGKSLLWSGPYELANEKKNRMIACGPDPNMIHRGAQALTVTVERHF